MSPILLLAAASGAAWWLLASKTPATTKSVTIKYRLPTGAVATVQANPQVAALMVQAAGTNNTVTMREVAGKLIDQGYKVEGSAMLQAIDAMAQLKIPGNQAVSA